MNLLHLKYAVEIADSASITKAAERLYNTQPNLSRAIRELESTLGIKIFKRTSKGITPTPEGEEFLGYARKILGQVDEIEDMYKSGAKKKMRFSISVPRASYISCAFTSFIEHTEAEEEFDYFYKETNALRAISNITESDFTLGILRYQSSYEEKFDELLEEKGLNSELVLEFHYMLLMSNASPLAEKETITLADLSPYTEIAHADPFVPSIPLSTVRRNELSDNVSRHIFVYERGSQMDILSSCPNTFMWVSPVPERLIKLYNLRQYKCAENDRMYRDVLIYRKNYALTETDKAFIDELVRIKREIKN